MLEMMKKSVSLQLKCMGMISLVFLLELGMNILCVYKLQ